MKMSENKVYNIDSLEFLKNIADDSVAMVYFDPPFFSQKQHKLTDTRGIEYAFDDIWKDFNSYDEFILENVQEIYRILSDRGSLFLHCDWHAVHRIRLVLDKIFGKNLFRSEIIWSYKKWSNSKSGLIGSHQTILYYSKTKNFVFNKIYQNYSQTTNIDQIMQVRGRDSRNKSIYKKTDDGNIIYTNEKKGVPLGDVWDIPILNPKAKERVGYPTQKPILLLERMIEISTYPNDLVVDPMCGSGTLAVAAKLSGRKYMVNDISAEAVSVTNHRLINPIKTQSNVLNEGRESYSTKDEETLHILKQLSAKVVQRNKGLDGLIYDSDEIIAVKIEDNNDSIDQQVSNLRKAMLKRSMNKGIFVRRFNSNDDYLFKDDLFNIKFIKTIGLQIESS